MNVDSFRNIPSFRVLKDEMTCIFKARAPKGLNLEFGMGRGVGLKGCAQLCPHLDFVGFDSFEGLPEAWAKGGYQAIKKAGALKCQVPTGLPENISVVEGFFEDVLPGWWEKHRWPISYMNIDSDLYSSARTVLRTLNDGIIPETLIRFDELCDWRLVFKKKAAHYEKWREGEWRALQEWMAEFDREVEPLCRNDTFAGTVRVLR